MGKTFFMEDKLYMDTTDSNTITEIRQVQNE